MLMKFSHSAAAVLGGLSVSLSSFVIASPDDGVMLEPVVVTPARTSQSIEQSLASVTVIERDAIETLNPQQFSDILQGRAGVDVATSGGFGQQTSVFIRGANSNQSILLIDGVRLGSASAGGAAWQFIPPEQIERVEVVRGPRSSIYGADAIGGVVQVFTRQGEVGPPAFDAHVGGGSFGSHNYGAGVRGGTEQTQYQLSAAHRHTDGINVLEDVGDDQRDGYHNTSANLSVDHRFNSKVSAFARVLHAQGRSAFNHEDFMQVPSSSAHIDFTQSVLAVGGRLALGNIGESQLTLAQSRDDQDTYIEQAFSDRFNTRMRAVHWQHQLPLGADWHWQFGVDWREDKLDSSVDYARSSRDNLGVYQVLQGQIDRHELQLALRHDDNESYGGETTGAVAWGYALTPALTSRVSYATGFNAPNFNQLYWPDFGNPDLQPETSKTVEAGLRYQQQAFYADIALYHTCVDDLIDQQPANVDARMRGAEFEAGWQQDDWRLRAAISLLDAENRDTGDSLARRPDQSLRVDVDRNLGRWSLGASAIARSHSTDYVFNPDTFETESQRLPGYAQFDLRAGYQVNANWQVSAQINNVLDQDYYTAAYGPDTFYQNPGRAFYLTLRYQQ